MQSYQEEVGGSPGRSGHSLSVEAGRIVFETRTNLAQLFQVSNPQQIIFTKNATEALNIAIFGILRAGDHCITTSIEHNSVMRPLRYLESSGTIQLTQVPCSPRGELDFDLLTNALRPNTKLLVVTHASNVIGTILPIAELAHWAKSHGLLFGVDGAQTTGCLPLELEKWELD